MEDYVNENLGSVKPKNSSEEALKRWRRLCRIVKISKRKFRFTANLAKRSEAEAIRRSNQIEEGEQQQNLEWSENFGSLKPKNSSGEASQKWRRLYGIVKNPKWKFCFTGNLTKRSEAEDIRRTNQIEEGEQQQDLEWGENFVSLQPKNSSEETLQKWRRLRGIVKNPEWKFRFTANLSRRSEAEAIQYSNQIEEGEQRQDLEWGKNFGSVKPKNSSEEALQKWRRLRAIVKNPKRKFSFIANLAKRSEAEAIQRSNQIEEGEQRQDLEWGENFGSVKPKNSSEEALQKWRKLRGIVKNPKWKFSFTDNLAKRSEAEAIQRSNQEEIRVAVNVQLAAYRFMGKEELEDMSLSEYTVSVAAEYRRIQECTDDGGSTVKARGIQDFVASIIKGQHAYKLLSKCKKSTIAVLSLVRNLFTYLVLEGTSFVVYILGYLVSEVISSLQHIFNYILLRPTSFVQRKLKYHVLDSLSSLREPFGNLVFEATSDIPDLVKKRKWSFLLGFVIAVCASILARATAATRQEFERQLIGAVEIVFSVIQWIIKAFCFTLADLGDQSNCSASVLLLLFSVATFLLFERDDNATDSSHGAYNISSRNLSISHVPAFDYVPSTANRFLPLIIRNLMNQTNLVNDLRLISSPASLMASPAYQVNQQYQWQLIKVCQLLGKHKKRSLAVFYVVLELASFFLDQWGKSKRGILLAAFLLSAFSFAMCMYTCIMRRTRGATRVQSEKKLVRTVKVAFSVAQFIVTLVYFVLAEAHVKINFSVSALPLVFAVIVAVFTSKSDGGASDSSGHTDDDLYGDLPVTNIPLVQAIRGTSNERFPFGMMVGSWNPERVLNMTYSTMAPAADYRHNLQYQLQNIQVHLPNNVAAQRAIDLTMFTRDEDAETAPACLC